MGDCLEFSKPPIGRFLLMGRLPPVWGKSAVLMTLYHRIKEIKILGKFRTYSAIKPRHLVLVGHHYNSKQ